MKATLGQILSVTTGILLVKDLDEVSDLLKFMTNDTVWFHAMPRLKEEVTPYLHEQLPFLKDITPDMVAGSNWKQNLEALEAKHGKYHNVIQMHLEDHISKDPVQEAIDMGVDPSKIITADDL